MKMNKDKHIGRVLFIVEGSKTEFSILRKVFCDILEYKYLEQRRNRPEAYVSRNDSHSKIAVVNTKESNIKDITDHSDYLDDVFNMLREKYQFPVNKSAIYYLFDRDPESNKDIGRIQQYINTLKNPYENVDGFRAGQLLLSYPSIESYIISHFQQKSYKHRLKLGQDAKAYIAQNKNMQLNKMNQNTLLHATEEFIQFLKAEEVDWGIDEFSATSNYVFEMQDQFYCNGEGFKVFSMLTLALLQLGIIDL